VLLKQKDRFEKKRSGRSGSQTEPSSHSDPPSLSESTPKSKIPAAAEDRTATNTGVNHPESSGSIDATNIAPVASIKQVSSESSARDQWAVCQVPTENGPPPKWFSRKEDAQDWQDEIVVPPMISCEEGEIPPLPEELKYLHDVERRLQHLIPTVTPVRLYSRFDSAGHEWTVIERVDGKPHSRGVGAYRKTDTGQSSVSVDELPPGYTPAIKRRDQGWQYLLPISWVSNEPGEHYTWRRFSDFLPLDRVTSSQSSDVESDIDAILELRHPEMTCDLGPDWEFDLIRADAEKREGHVFHGRKIESLPHQLTLIAYDLDRAVHRYHPHLSAENLALFWTSWRVWQYFAMWTVRILREIDRRGREAGLVRPIDYAAALSFIRYQTWAYAHEIRTFQPNSDASCKTSVPPATPTQQGPAEEHEPTLTAEPPVQHGPGKEREPMLTRAPSTDSVQPKARRGRPQTIPDELKLKALNAKGGKERARILYGTKFPTRQQINNTYSILRNYKKKRKSE
jgi:hypothetical protein